MESFNITLHTVIFWRICFEALHMILLTDPIGFNSVAYPTNFAREENIGQGMDNHLLICVVCEASTWTAYVFDPVIPELPEQCLFSNIGN